MEVLQEQLNALVTGEAWPGIAVALRIVLAVMVLRLFLLVLFHARSGPRVKRSGIIPSQFFVFVPLLVLFVGTLVYQASWQLFGRSRPQFVQFMQKYDRRQFNPAHSISRGKILDRKGRIIAYSHKKGGQVERHYRLGPMFSHVVGYADPRFGMTGIESAAHTHLIGGGLGSFKEWQELGKSMVDRQDSAPGQDLTLTLDVELQSIAYNALKKKMGAAILMDVQNGEILALVSAPAFDPNDIAREVKQVEAEGGSLLNRATQGLYPPGSTFKVLVAATAMRKGWSEKIDCPADGFTTSSNYPKIRDHEFYAAESRGASWGGHGVIDMNYAVTRSSNVFFAQLGVLLGHDALREEAVAFGINDSDYLYETLGDKLYVTRSRYPDLAKSDQYGLAQVSIGQGKLLVTPMQMCMVTAAIANDGLLMQPRLQLDQKPEKLRRCMNEQHAQLLQTMMRSVVTRGTGRAMANAGFTSGGKTGTAQNPHGAAHGWFIGFAPAENPRLAVSVLVENGGYGSSSALPIARSLLVEAHKQGYLEAP